MRDGGELDTGGEPICPDPVRENEKCLSPMVFGQVLKSHPPSAGLPPKCRKTCGGWPDYLLADESSQIPIHTANAVIRFLVAFLKFPIALLPFMKPMRNPNLPSIPQADQPNLAFTFKRGHQTVAANAAKIILVADLERADQPSPISAERVKFVSHVRKDGKVIASGHPESTNNKHSGTGNKSPPVCTIHMGIREDPDDAIPKVTRNPEDRYSSNSPAAFASRHWKGDATI
ncbi:hypothetical protein BV22DRAFT_1120400 [Leucogyrophana mollusca]|uniref:Uncharacterized protein n=1 Tax=Leucogyrophana mollusca TaxID=85980 RepID=A0ACB8BF76_9AGAM|nr:hypothetical protein BV22DRAFT_1120400 [Leucogyrophana mollusca]